MKNQTNTTQEEAVTQMLKKEWIKPEMVEIEVNFGKGFTPDLGGQAS